MKTKLITALEALDRIYDYHTLVQKDIVLYLLEQDNLPSYYKIVKNALKTNQKKLDTISEILVDVSKGNYANMNIAINEIREVLKNE